MLSYLFLCAFLIQRLKLTTTANFRQDIDMRCCITGFHLQYSMSCRETTAHIFSAKLFPGVGLDMSAPGTMMEMAPKLSELQKPHTDLKLRA